MPVTPITGMPNLDRPEPSTRQAVRQSASPTLHPSDEAGEPAVRPLLAIEARSVIITDARRGANFEAATHRWRRFFDEPEPAQHAADLLKATRVIDHALTANGDEVPKDVQALMVDMLARTFELDRALTDGPANVLLSEDVQGFTHLIEKDRVRSLGDFLYESMRAPRLERPIQFTAKISAIGLLLGAGGCAHHAHMGLLKLASVFNRIPSLRDRIELTLCTSPFKGSAENGRRDHAYGTVRYLDDGGTWHTILFNPWADMDRVIPESNSPYFGAFEEKGYLRAVDASTKDLVFAHMKVADTLLESARRNPLYEQRQTRRETRALEANAAGKPMEGYYPYPIRSAKPGVQGTLEPRDSLLNESRSALLSDERTSVRRDTD
jgi:hypothetical protein